MTSKAGTSRRQQLVSLIMRPHTRRRPAIVGDTALRDAETEEENRAGDEQASEPIDVGESLAWTDSDITRDDQSANCNGDECSAREHVEQV